MENCWTRKYDRTKAKIADEFMYGWKVNNLKICFTKKWLIEVLDVYYLQNENKDVIDFPRLICMLALISDGYHSSEVLWEIAEKILSISGEEIEIWKACRDRYEYYNDRGERLLLGENIDVAMEDIARERGLLLQKVKETWRKIEEIKAKRGEGEINEGKQSYMDCS